MRHTGQGRASQRTPGAVSVAVIAAACAIATGASCAPSVMVISEGTDSSLGAAGEGAGGSATGAAGGAAGATGAGAQGGAHPGTGGTSGAGGGELPDDGASTPCQILASVGVWQDDPQGNACVVCVREMSGQDGIVLTSCSTLGNHCYVTSGCSAVFLCLSDGDYTFAAIEECTANASASDLELFLAFLECVLPWCGNPDQCAYSGPTPGCALGE